MIQQVACTKSIYLPVSKVSDPQLQIPAMKRGMMTPKSPHVSKTIRRAKKIPLIRATKEMKKKTTFNLSWSFLSEH